MVDASRAITNRATAQMPVISRGAAIFLALLLAALVGGGLWLLEDAQSDHRKAERVARIADELGSIKAAARDALSAIRLHESTRDDRYLRQRDAALARANKVQSRLRSLATDDPADVAALEALIALTAEAAAVASMDDADRIGRISELSGELMAEARRSLLLRLDEARRATTLGQGLLAAASLGAGATMIGLLVLTRRQRAGESRARAIDAAKIADAHGEERQLLEALVRQSAMAIFCLDPDRRVVLWNPAAERMFGWEANEIQGQPYPLVPTDLRTDHDQIFRRFASGERMENLEVVRLRKDGTPITAVFSGTPLYDAAGTFRGISFMAEDVTQRRATEQQLRQAQKMEALGQLTGGIAHDFNNLLLVILGSLELVEEDLGETSELRHELRRAIRAGERGATLTKSLLSFARKQPLAPTRLDANKLVGDTIELMRRSLSETIEIRVVEGAGLWQCEIDAGQLQNALLNLAINARDAMPKGGKLTIETANAVLDRDYAAQHTEVAAGQYVCMTVSDTGTGMPPDVVRKAFDPFFTTKSGGKGNGLGLSMVYGFVKQSGGHIKIYSEVGIGTSIKLYLPRKIEERDALATPIEGAIPGGTETILLVEDEADVRGATVKQIKALGYRVLEAASADEALLALSASEDVALLLTDMVLAGGLNGRELSEKALERRPDLKVLYMSGYTDAAIERHGRLDPGVSLLQKPFRRRDLGLKLRSALDAPLASSQINQEAAE